MRYYGISGPGKQSMIENMAFNMYAQHQQSIEDAIDMLAAADDPNDPRTQMEIFCRVGIKTEYLTPAEIDYIEKEVSKRW
jgi:hypothetical protein